MAIATFKATTKGLDGLKVEANARGFKVTLDEPPELGGTDQGMNPVELLLCALGACQVIVAKAYAKKFRVPFEDFHVELEGDLDPAGFMGKKGVKPGFQQIRYHIHITTDAPEERVHEFIKFIEATCPVGDTLARPVPLVLADTIIKKPKAETATV